MPDPGDGKLTLGELFNEWREKQARCNHLWQELCPDYLVPVSLRAAPLAKRYFRCPYCYAIAEKTRRGALAII